MVATPVYVVFDLETNADRPDPSEHEIIQIGAVAGSAGAELDSFETLVRPERRLPARITELTGLEYGDLAGAPTLRSALEDFLRWVGNRPLIAHNGFGYDFPVLEGALAATGLAATSGARLDTLELAHLVYPRAGAPTRNLDGTRPPSGRRLDDLAREYGRGARDRHDALEDARLTRAVMLRMLEELNRTTPARRLQRWILGVAGHPWAAFLEQAPEPPPLHEVVPRMSPPAAIRPTNRFDIDAVVGSFRSGGALMAGERTPRAPQAEMAGMVARALCRDGARRMIEAPTGTGKTLAYLVPAIEMARASGRTAVITPHSRVLQDQILATLEELDAEIGPFTRVVVKGRQNYLSLRALDAELAGLAGESERGGPDHPAAISLAIISGWVAETPTGDWADLRTRALSHLGPLPFYRWKLRVESRPGPISGPLDSLDFHRRALIALRTAHVAVLNHALLATGPELESSSFNLVIDEAHGLEDSVTAAATLEVSEQALVRLCDALWDGRTRRGLVARLAAAMTMSLRTASLNRIRTTAQEVRDAIERFGAPLTRYVRDRTGTTREQAARYGAAYRIRRGVDTGRPDYRTVLRRGRAVRHALREVVDALDAITAPANPAGRYRRDALEDEIFRLGREASQAGRLIDGVLSASTELLLFNDLADHELVEWINIAEVSFDSSGPPGSDAHVVTGPEGESMPGRWRWALRRSPLSVAGLLADLWDRSHSTVLTSATLRSGDDFGYLVGRLGLGSVESKVIDSPFENLPEQHLLLLTDYLPAPRGSLMDRFTETEATEIPRLCAASDGGGMALMTARARLDYVRNHARPHLDGLGIELLAQGDASAQVLIERMRADPEAMPAGNAVLLGGRRHPGRGAEAADDREGALRPDRGSGGRRPHRAARAARPRSLRRLHRAPGRHRLRPGGGAAHPHGR